jgi:predicted DNA-binding ribbon-helix-helix protein
MKSSVVKRSIVVGGHKTSVSLEDAFWRGLKEIAGRRDISVSDLVAAIDSERQHGNLSSAIRLFVLGFYRDQISGRQASMRETLLPSDASPSEISDQAPSVPEG